MSLRHIGRLTLGCLPLLLLPLLSAATPPGSASGSPNDLIREANAAFLRGDTEAADQLYAAAEERTADPGLVAFNRGAVLFQREEYRAAEVHYARALDDRACPPERAVRAWYNRGTCLLRRGGDAGAYRSAIACFERCLELGTADESLQADARHNLELAKVLWAEANRKAAKPESPNSIPPEEQNEPPVVPPGMENQDPSGSDPGDRSTNPNGARPNRQQARAPAGPPGAQKDTTSQAPGNNQALQVLPDQDKPVELSPEDARAHLKVAEDRGRRAKQAMLRALYGPDRPGVNDW